MDDRIHISSIVLHRGEEPPISGEKGIVNVFFPSCNMQCVYCQNWEISCRGTEGTVMSLDEVCDAIIELLPSSENNLGFVSPTHFTLQMVNIVEELRLRGHNPTIIYNTNGYDLPETLRTLEDIVDVWLPDFKYSDDTLAVDLSETPRYSEYALAALREMVHQVGATLHIDDRGIARRGIIIRHLVLPGQVENSTGVLKLIAKHLSPNLHVSVMSQYYPPDKFQAQNRKFETATKEQDQSRTRTCPDEVGSVGTKIANLNLQHCGRFNPVHGPVPMKSGVAGRKFLDRTITRQEYDTVIDAFHNHGLSNGWLQAYQSHKNYRPDFSKDHPFE
jgi:putative pyruvate formate lyase activating enzyme